MPDNLRGRALRSVVVLGLAALVSGVVAAQVRTESVDAVAAKRILDLAGVRRGLCVHLGSGRAESPGLTAELAAGSQMLVHGLAFDDASLTRARSAVEAKGLMGRATVEKAAVPPLPYLRDLADLVVIEDFGSLAARGVTMDEVLRVVAPGGVACILKDGTWTKTVKPRPVEMDEWTHPYHGPDGNIVSTDAVVALPLGYRWLDGFPKNVTGFAATRAWVIAGGRLFTLGINEKENLGAARGRSGYDLYLSARNAWNGLPLWKVNCGNPTDGTAIMWQNIAPLAADDAHAYTVDHGKTVAVDAATGRTVVTYETKHPTVRLLLLEGVLVTGGWEAQDRPKGQWVWFPKSDVGSVEGFDAATGRAKWSVPVCAYQMVASHGVVYVMTQPTATDADVHVIALDLQTGRERWRVPHSKLGTERDLVLNCAGDGFVVLAKAKERKALVLSADDGRVLWQQACRSTWLPLVDGLLWADMRRDPKTGDDKGRLPRYLGGHHCRFRAIAGRFLTSNYGFTELAPEPGGPAELRSTLFRGARGACVEDWVPANGMFYTAQNGCKCVPGAVYGVVAIGPNGDWPAGADFETARPVEKGPAFGTDETAATGDDDWPTWRHDAGRSGATNAAVPEKLTELWKAQVVKSDGGPLAAAWDAQLTSCVSAPVVVSGRVFVAGTDTGQVVALDAVTGKEVWSTTLGGRIDTPPTVYRGLCLVGCHDGWVYALRAGDGELAWRMRPAPRERRMVAWGAVESVWPAVGTVLVHDGVAFATAGRSSESDGGIALVAFDPLTGSQHWSKAIAPGVLRLNDVLSVRDGSPAWRYMRFDAKTGDVTAPVPLPDPKDYGGGAGKLEGAMMDGTWTFLRNRQAGSAFTVGKLTADLLVWNDSLVVTPAFAVTRETADDADALKERKYAWQTGIRRDRQVVSMVLSRGAVLLAGRFTRTRADGQDGFLWVLSSADGTRTAEFPLDAVPAYDGIAVANGRVYVSLRNGSVVCLGKPD